METLLRLQRVRYGHERTAGAKLMQQRDQERLCCRGDTSTRKRAALSQAPLQGLPSGGLRDGGKQVVRHRP